MKLLTMRKDGGQDSNSTGYWLIEWKRLFSISIIKFDGKSREAFHNHAFNCFSWVLRGHLMEQRLNIETGEIDEVIFRPASWRPFITKRSHCHKVSSITAKPSWILNFRGPWCRYWLEWRPLENRWVVLTHGRVEVA